MKQMDRSISAANTKVLITCAVTAKLTCAFVLAYHAKLKFIWENRKGFMLSLIGKENCCSAIEYFEPRCEKTGLRTFRPGPKPN